MEKNKGMTAYRKPRNTLENVIIEKKTCSEYLKWRRKIEKTCYKVEEKTENPVVTRPHVRQSSVCDKEGTAVTQFINMM